MTTEVINSSEEKLKKTLETLKKDFGTIRARLIITARPRPLIKWRMLQFPNRELL